MTALPQHLVQHLADRHRHQLGRDGGGPVGPHVHVAHRHQLVLPLPDGQAEPVALPPDLLRRHGGPEQLVEELLPQEGQAALIGLVEPVDVAPLLDLLIQGVFDPAEDVAELGCVHRLEDILHHVELDGLLGKLKLVEAGKDDEPHPGLPPGQLGPQLQPVHKGHLDVGEHHVQIQVLRLFQGVPPVFRVGDDLEPQGVPVDFSGDALADLRFVVHHHDVIETHGCLPWYHVPLRAARERTACFLPLSYTRARRFTRRVFISSPHRHFAAPAGFVFSKESRIFLFLFEFFMI